MEAHRGESAKARAGVMAAICNPSSVLDGGIRMSVMTTLTIRDQGAAMAETHATVPRHVLATPTRST